MLWQSCDLVCPVVQLAINWLSVYSVGWLGMSWFIFGSCALVS